MNFKDWKALPFVAETVPAIVSIDMKKITSWSEYKDAVYQADRSQIRKKAAAWTDHRENAEIVAFMAVLWSMDYSDLAGELAKEHAIGNLFGTLNYTGQEHRDVVAGVLLQAN